MFVLKKWISALIMPMPLLLLVVTAGLIALLLNRRRVATGLLGLGWLMLVVIFISPLPRWMIATLEAPFSQHEPNDTGYQYIVVLGGGHNSDPRQPLSSRLKSFSLARISEGIRLAKLYPDATLVLSGYAGNESRSNAAVMREFAMGMGIDPARILLFETPRDTAEEAGQIAPLIRQHPTLLVTSAFHMQRALKLFAWQGCWPSPAVAQFLSVAPQTETNDNSALKNYLPGASGLVMLEFAWHEWLGILWAELAHMKFQHA